jgi:acyl-CoA reductase-like NAD-dependent aldehyde dehydrogenase
LVNYFSDFRLNNVGTTTPERVITKISPINLLPIYDIPISENEEVSKLFQNINNRFDKKVNVVERSKMLVKFCRELEKIESEINYIVQIETAKPMKIVQAEFNAALSFMLSLAGLATFKNGISIPSSNVNKTVYTRNFPYGIACLITSFNTPLPNYAWKLAPSFLAGNASILKPSEHTSLSAQLFIDCFNKVDLPEFAVNLIHGNGETVKHLIRKKPELISFTGSSKVGLEINSLANLHSPKIILEMGGSNPFIVCESADLEAASPIIIDSAFSNAGQRCASGSRLIVHENAYKSLLSKLENQLMKTKVGINEDSFYGGLISLKASESHIQYLNRAKQAGLKVSEFGKIDGQMSSSFVLPAIIEVPIELYDDFSDEVFSPILRVTKFERTSEALDLANRTDYGLVAAVWTRNFTEASYFTDNIESGVINVNGPTHGAEYQFPFGGAKNSGNGSKEVGYSSLDEYSFVKLISSTNHG